MNVSEFIFLCVVWFTNAVIWMSGSRHRPNLRQAGSPSDAYTDPDNHDWGWSCSIEDYSLGRWDLYNLTSVIYISHPLYLSYHPANKKNLIMEIIFIEFLVCLPGSFYNHHFFCLGKYFLPNNGILNNQPIKINTRWHL